MKQKKFKFHKKERNEPLTATGTSGRWSGSVQQNAFLWETREEIQEEFSGKS